MILDEFELRFPGDHPNRKLVREYLAQTCESFINSGHADPKFLTEITSGEEQKLWASITEALVADQLSAHVFGARKKLGAGPDFLVMNGEQRVWIEVICPGPTDVPQDWLEVKFGTCVKFPYQEILLRWTSAIKAKVDQQIGSIDGKKIGYLKSGLTNPADAYVIAVNGCRLRNGPFPGILGISQFPFAAEAVYPIGPFAYQIDRTTCQIVSGGHQYQPFVTNKNGAKVPSDTFLDPRLAPISAIWALDLNGCSVLGNKEPRAVIHNVNAAVPLSIGFLPCDHEYLAVMKGEDLTISKYPLDNNSIMSGEDLDS